MPEVNPPATVRPRPASGWALFTAFTVLALQGFGGVIAVAQRELCERRGWLTQAEFLAMLGTAQVLPGPNVCNLSLMVGDHFHGWRGALAALAGMVAVPMALVLLLAWALGQIPPSSVAHGGIQGAIWGVTAVAAGQIIGTVLKLSKPLKQHPLGWPASIAVAATALLLMTALKWPLVWVLLSLGPLACLWTWHVLKARRSPQP